MAIFGEAAISSLLAAGRPAAAASDIEKDWMRQDSGRVDVSACFADAKSNPLESGMAEAVVAELERLAAPSAAARCASLAALRKEGRPGNDPAWRALYLTAARERRALRLKKLVAKTRQVFFTRHCVRCHSPEAKAGGSATSSLTKRLERAHCGTDLTQDEKDTVCAWIDLAVPYCGSYLEGRAWDAEDEEAYARFQRKRVAYAAQELADLRKALGYPFQNNRR